MMHFFLRRNVRATPSPMVVIVVECSDALNMHWSKNQDLITGTPTLQVYDLASKCTIYPSCVEFEASLLDL